jgi:hypothetical protein
MGEVGQQMGRKPGNPATYSVYQLQQKAAAQGVKLSHKQIADAVKHGLIPEPDAENRWPPVALDVLLASAALAPRVPLLSDRAVLLYDTFANVITPETVRESMAKVLNGIEERERKLAWVHAHASRIEPDHLELRPPALFLAFRGVSADKWLPLYAHVWGNPFATVRTGMFAMSLDNWYRLAELLEPEREAAETAGMTLPREELLTVLAARNIYAEAELLFLFAEDVLTGVGKAISSLTRYLQHGWQEIRKAITAKKRPVEQPTDAGQRAEEQDAPQRREPDASQGGEPRRHVA